MFIANVLKLIRIKDWLKNIIIFLPLVFSEQFFNTPNYTSLIIAFLLFSIVSSLIYVVNDILDINRDSVHPNKKIIKPLANGNLSLMSAYFILSILIFMSVLLVIPQNYLIMHVITYLILSLMYNFFLKKIPYLEFIILAFGYIIRIDAGSVIIQVESSFLMLSAIYFLVIFFILLKRLGEINNEIDFNLYNTRDVIKYYKPLFIKIITLFSILILNVILIYYVYLKNIKLILALILINIFLFLYYNLVRNTTDGENPINFILSNKILLALSILILLSSFIIYV